jgi:hypothetical protein
MTNTLATFADQVTTVAREVGVEGRLGGQANVPGTAGTWKDLAAEIARVFDPAQTTTLAQTSTNVVPLDVARRA